MCSAAHNNGLKIARSLRERAPLYYWPLLSLCLIIFDVVLFLLPLSSRALRIGLALPRASYKKERA